MRAVQIFAVAFLIVGLSAAAAAADNVIIYFSDQNLDAILRMQDLNHDGDTLDDGDVIVFCDKDPDLTGIKNTQGMILLAPGELLAADNFDPVNIVHLVDLNGDGDVDLSDLAALLAVYGTCSGDPGFDAAADLDASGCVDLADLATLLAHYGE